LFAQISWRGNYQRDISRLLHYRRNSAEKKRGFFLPLVEKNRWASLLMCGKLIFQGKEVADKGENSKLSPRRQFLWEVRMFFIAFLRCLPFDDEERCSPPHNGADKRRMREKGEGARPERSLRAQASTINHIFTDWYISGRHSGGVVSNKRGQRSFARVGHAS